MRDRSFSQEERMQREKEARSRQRKQEQAYREAQRGSIPGSMKKQNAMPEDYRQAFWEDPPRPAVRPGPPGRPEPAQEEDWEEEPASRSRRTCGTIPGPSLPPPGGGQRPAGGLPKRPTGQRTQRNPSRTTGTGRRKRMPGSPLSPARVQEEGAPGSGAPSPRRGRKGDSLDPGGGQPPRKSKRRKVLLIVLIVLLALVAAGVIIHQIYVRPPEIPSQETSQVPTPAS